MITALDGTDLALASATDVAAAIATRQLSSRELTDVFLARIDAFDGQLGSYLQVLEDRARPVADAADAAVVRGDGLRPLHGVPANIKDLQQLWCRQAVASTAHVDAMLAPGLTGPSRPNGYYEGWDGADVFADQTAFVGVTPFANLTGQPAISLPLHHHDDEVGPVGVQLVGRPWDDAGLLRIAAQLEAAAPWRARRPDLG